MPNNPNSDNHTIGTLGTNDLFGPVGDFRIYVAYVIEAKSSVQNSIIALKSLIEELSREDKYKEQYLFP